MNHDIPAGVFCVAYVVEEFQEHLALTHLVLHKWMFNEKVATQISAKK